MSRARFIPLATAGLVLSGMPGPATASANSCLSVVRAWKEAVDSQSNGSVAELTWADGYTQWPQRDRGKWSDIQMSGPYGKYATTLARVRVFPVVGATQIVEVKAITRRMVDDRYTGDYMVSKESYTCKRRSGQWRIYSQVVSQREDLRNKPVARRYERAR